MHKTLRTFILLAFAVVPSLYLHAQDGSITIEQDAKIEQLLAMYSKVNSNTGHYQIQVGFGSYQKAQNLKTRVESDFPGWYSKIEFESPTYRVRLGKFKTKLEAERKFLEVRKKYPEAMLLKPEKNIE